jgi:Holliday junction resolvasome RuvABC endonuclease subunit
MRNWGIAEAILDLDTGVLSTPRLSLCSPEDIKTKQTRQNSNDLHLAKLLYDHAICAARRNKVIFVECPVGSKSASSMKGYGMCVGILGAIRAEGHEIIEVTAFEVKESFTGKKLATKEQMIAQGVLDYPDANWPRQERNGAKHKKGDLKNEAEHVADAIAAIHAGVRTPMFQNLMRLFATL